MREASCPMRLWLGSKSGVHTDIITKVEDK